MNNTNEYDIFDVLPATVIDSCNKGIFLRLEGGDEAFAYFGRLPIGTKLLCSVRKKATANLRALVSVDTVIAA